MKKSSSILILVGIILGSFFAQDANANSFTSPVTIHAGKAHGGRQDFHKNLIFSEISTETETTEQRVEEVDFLFIYEVVFEIRCIKNILSSILFHAISTQLEINSLPTFLAVRSIRI